MLDLDNETLLPLNILTYSFDLVEANALGSGTQPAWHEIYSYREAYQMEDLSPESFMRLSERVLTDDSVKQLMYDNYFSGLKSATQI